MNEAFEKWHKEHSKYMEPADIVPWCKDAFRAGMLAAAEMERSKK